MSCASGEACRWKVSLDLHRGCRGEELTIRAEVIEEARAKLKSTELTPVTAERFLAWKADKIKKKCVRSMHHR